jgi:hypothetical protein
MNHRERILFRLSVKTHAISRRARVEMSVSYRTGEGRDPLTGESIVKMAPHAVRMAKTGLPADPA